MLFDQYHSQDLLTSAIADGCVIGYNTNVPSPDFFLNDYIDVYLSPVQSKTEKYDSINDSNNDFSQHHEEFFSELKFEDITDALANDDLEIGQWISQSAFPSPINTSNDSLSNVEDPSPIILSTSEQYVTNIDMIVPTSPSLSSISSSEVTKKLKLTPIERKMRKKDQNKTAAEKYRIKKKSQHERLIDRHVQLKNSNKDLTFELESLTFQVQKLKQLFVEVLQIPLPVPN